VRAGVLDTSVFIANESGRGLDRELLPEEGYVTIITLAELEAGALAAQTPEVQAIRLRTLQELATVEQFDIDENAAHEWALLRYKLARVHQKVNVNDLWIAAVAKSRGLPIVTQGNDFDAIADLGGPTVIHV